MIVNVNGTSLGRETSNIDGYLTDFNTHINNIRQKVTDMSTAWQDESYTNFQTQMTTYLTELSSIKSQIESYNKYVKGYLESVDSLDKDYSTEKTITIK